MSSQSPIWTATSSASSTTSREMPDETLQPTVAFAYQPDILTRLLSKTAQEWADAPFLNSTPDGRRLVEHDEVSTGSGVATGSRDRDS